MNILDMHEEYETLNKLNKSKRFIIFVGYIFRIQIQAFIINVAFIYIYITII